MADLRIELESLKNLVIEAATYNRIEEAQQKEYASIRTHILSVYADKSKLPKCIKTCSTLSQIRGYFQSQSDTYKGRRDLIEVEFEDSLAFDNNTIDFEKAVDEIEKNKLNILPDDIQKKGREMSGIYYILYCIENSLRIYIENKFLENYGENYIDSITIPGAIKKSIALRKEQEDKNLWLSIRGESDLFYMDFKELGDIILNNWDIFKRNFPDQAWIKTKIDELGNCRNLIAHNSYIGEHERNVINVNYRSIIKQISK